MLKTEWDERQEREAWICNRISLVACLALLAVAIIARCCEA